MSKGFQRIEYFRASVQDEVFFSFCEIEKTNALKNDYPYPQAIKKC